MQVWGVFDSSTLRIQQNSIWCLSHPRAGIFFDGFWISWRPFPIMSRDNEGEKCPHLCPEPLRSTQAALLVMSAGTGGLCPKKTPVKDVLGNFSRKPSDLKNLHKGEKIVCLLVKRLNALSGCISNAIMCCKEHRAPRKGSSELHPLQHLRGCLVWHVLAPLRLLTGLQWRRWLFCWVDEIKSQAESQKTAPEMLKLGTVSGCKVLAYGRMGLRRWKLRLSSPGENNANHPSV